VYSKTVLSLPVHPGRAAAPQLHWHYTKQQAIAEERSQRERLEKSYRFPPLLAGFIFDDLVIQPEGIGLASLTRISHRLLAKGRPSWHN